MHNESVLRERAREAMKERELPNRRPDRMWGGPGSGASCAICQTPVTAQEMGFDLEFGHLSGGSVATHAMHIRCFAVWELERNELVIDDLHKSERQPTSLYTNGMVKPEETGAFDVSKLRASAGNGTTPHHGSERTEGVEFE